LKRPSKGPCHRPALPVPRPGRDREARHFWNTVWSLQYFVSKLFVLMLCMPGLPAIPARHPAGGWQAGLGQGHNQKKDTHTLDFYVTLSVTKRLWNGLKSYGRLKRGRAAMLWLFHQEISIFWESRENYRTGARRNQFLPPCSANNLKKFQTART
jgi:hypothetical protein